jgi:hypothetical protein
MPMRRIARHRQVMLGGVHVEHLGELGERGGEVVVREEGEDTRRASDSHPVGSCRQAGASPRRALQNSEQS